jgi:hypothetical protein
MSAKVENSETVRRRRGEGGKEEGDLWLLDLMRPCLIW